MLKKSFKIAKCKTSLKLATSRIKLMKNKKVEQINHMKRELAQLLASGDDRTARIRVEHVIREEKMIAAYDLIEIYCELIVARLPIIESQKTCPIDLKEAVTSVIFAAPRCSDIPELADVRKNFTAKYGKEFVSGAIELRPDCGVSRMLVEKLSAVAPDIQTKMKVLTAVAKEHNINWDSTSFEEKESKPPDDLLNGPTNFEKASMMSVDPLKIQTTSVPIVHHYEGFQNPNVPLDFAQQNKRFTADSKHKTNLDTGGVQTSYASTTHNDMRPSGSTPGTMNMRQSFNNNQNEHWNMEFKDATSAAQAAAESAERASFAARAAAELSRQYSNESRQSHISEEKHQVLYNDNYNISLNDRKPKIQNQQTGATDIVTSPKANKRSSSLRSRNDSVKKSLVNQSEIHEDYGPSPEMVSKSKFENRYTSGDMSTSDPRKVGQNTVVGQGRVFKETTRTGSYGDAHKDETDSDSDDDHGPKFDTGIEYDEGEAKLFFPSPERGSFRPTEETYVSSPKSNMGQVKISKSVGHSVKSDLSDGPYSESESETGQTSFGRIKKVKSPNKHDILSTDHQPVYEESSPKANARKSRIELDDLVENESENAMGKSRFSGTNNFSPPRKHQLLYTNSEPTFIESSSPKVNSGKSPIQLNDLVETGQDSENESEMRKSSLSSTKKLTSPHKHDVFSVKSESANVKSSPKDNSRKSRIELDDLVEMGSSFDNQSDDLDTGSDLKFGTLTGGLRNKGGLKYPPYTNTAVKESHTKVDPTSRPSSFNKRQNVSVSSELDSDDHSERSPVESSKSRSQFAPPDLFFNNDETDPEEEVSSDRKQTYTSKVHSGSGLSRRTKGQVQPVGKTIISNQSPAEARSYTESLKKNSDTKLESSEFSSASAEREPSTKSHSTKSSPEPQSDPARFKQEPFKPRPARFKQEPSRSDPTRFKQEPSRSDPTRFKQEPSQPDPARFKQESSRPDPVHLKQEPSRPGPARFKQEQSPPDPARFEQEPSRPNPARFKHETSKTMPEPKISEQLSNPSQKGPESGKPDASKTVNPGSTSPEASNVKKPSHVHPKLPEYDSLAARIQALSKMNR